MQIRDIMTKNVEVIPVNCSVQEAAQKMKDLNVGALPIGDKSKVQGLLTDRDIAIQVVAAGKNPQSCKVQEIMTSPIQWIDQDSSVEEAADMMSDKQIRRLLVMDRNQKPVGFLSLGDIATKVDEQRAGESLQDISRPSQPAH